MSAESDTSAHGIESRIGWPIGSIAGGAFGAVAFGLVLWMLEPAIIEEAIPEFYGLNADPVVGWALHLVHGAIIGLGFGMLVTRGPILGIIRTPTETDALSRTGITLRLVGAGGVYGLAIWAILPMIALPVIGRLFGVDATTAFLGAAVETLVAHVLYGLVLGLVFALTIDLRDRPTESPIED